MDALRLLSRSTSIKPRQKTGDTPQTLPSEGNVGPVITRTQGQKRKREEGTPEADLTEEGIREVQKSHKIRIVNLRKLHKSTSSKSKKQQKESARIFPQPLSKFSQLQPRYQIGKVLNDNINQQGYHEPTEVQIATVPLLLGRNEDQPDLLTVAPTGSGKTLAFLIPTIDKIRKTHHADSDRHVHAMILAPTKELEGQIVNEGRKLCAGTGVTITAMRKGMRLTDPSDAARHSEAGSDDDDDAEHPRATVVKADILVSTPLSLVHALGSEKLPKVHMLILDEADVLLDQLFREQTLAIWSACTSLDLRVSLWSATIGSNIEELALSTINTRRKDLGIKSTPPLYRVVVGLKDSSLPSISHKLIYAATEPGKLLGLRQLLHPSRPYNTSRITTSSQPPQLRPPFLVFTQTIDRATSLHTELKYDIPAAAGGSSRIAVLHSSLSSTARSTIMTKFRRGEIWILITTDLLSRGVDFRGVNGVVNYDIPTTSASYVHRAGRTGRAGRKGGMCVTFYTKEDVRYLKAIASVIKASVANGAEDGKSNVEGVDSWILSSLPELSKKDRKELKERGVEGRRAIKQSDDADARKKKRKNRIGTKSGYERREENRKTGAVQGSKARKAREGDEDGDDDGNDFTGFD